MSAPRLDAANLAGITTLMNVQNIKSGINLDSIEKEIMGKTEEKRHRHNDTDPVKIYTRELNQLAEELGIDIVDDEIVDVPSSSGSVGMLKTTIVDVNDFLEIKHDRHNTSDKHSALSDKHDKHSASSDKHDTYDKHDKHDKHDKSKKHSKYKEESESESDTGTSYTSHSSRSSRSSDSSRSSRSSRSSDSSGSSGSSRSSGSSGSSGSSSYTSSSSRSSRSRKHKKLSSHLTPISENRSYINNVVGDIRRESTTVVGEERERTRDIKASKLEQIGQLRMTLEEEGIDCSSVTKPNIDSSMDEIDSVINILRLKNDRNRYSSIAEEVILGIAEGIETVFDGSRRVPLVGWRPDYTGYHNTVNVKLHRMRFETSQVVGNIIEKHQIGPTARIVMELLPSFFLYPRQQKKQKSTPGLSSDPYVTDARHAYNTIRESEERKTLDDIRNI